MKNNKGFTLIELIGVVVIMGMILLIVFPATSRIIRSNENKKYDTYYDAVQEQLELYARTRRDELGGIKGSGCVDDKKISELKSYDYIKEFTDEKDITCLSPGDFPTDRLGALGIDTSKQYVNVRIENDKGKIKVQYSLICVRNYDDPSVMSLQYKKLIEKEGTCENYVPVVTNSLLNVVKGSLTVENSGTTSYVTGNPSNNYVWYSGKMWRIINYDLTDRTIKLASDDIVSIVNYDNKMNASNQFSNDYSISNIYVWLNNVFLPSLRNTEKYLLDVEWNYSNVAASVSAPIVNGNTVVSKVGMLNNYEYSKGSSYLNKGKNFWLVSTTGTDKAWYVNTSGVITSSTVSEFYGVRPSIVLKPNVTMINGGNGTVNNPYRLTGDIGGNIGTYLNTRFPGEYVKVNGITYRISTVDPKYTKLVALNTIPIDSSIASTLDHITSNDYNSVSGTIKLHFFDKVYSDNSFIGEYLKKWSASIDDKLEEEGGDFCRMTITKTTSQTVACPQEDIIKTKIAIPKIGDMFTIGANAEYWTLNNSTTDKLNVILPQCAISNKSVTSLSSILPVLVIKNTVTIAGGNGTPNSPYTIQ